MLEKKTTRAAPVLITVYNRLNHLKNCIDSLKLNRISKDTPLYLAIDFPKSESDLEVHNKIVEYSKGITGFKYVRVIVREKNLGPYLNAKYLQDLVFEKYDMFIRTEDDNVFSQEFLEFMNYMLAKYESDRTVFSINAFNFPTNDIAANEYYKIKEFYPYGFASWKDRYLLADRQLSKFFTFFSKPKNWFIFRKNCGFRVLYGLMISVFRNITYTDYVLTFHLNVENMYAIVPKVSFVRNEGQDGSGVNSGVTNGLLKQATYTGAYNLDEVVDQSLSYKEHIKRRDDFFNKELPPIARWKKLLTPCLYLYLYLRQFINPYKY